MAENVAQGGAEDEAIAALRYLIDEEGSACVNGTDIRFMQLGEVIDTGDGVGFRARQSGVFARSVSGMDWAFQARYDQFDAFARTPLKQAGEVQCAVICLRAAILNGKSLLTEMDKEAEAEMERMLAAGLGDKGGQDNAD